MNSVPSQKFGQRQTEQPEGPRRQVQRRVRPERGEQAQGEADRQSATRAAASASSRVTGRRLAISADTGWPERSE